MTKADPLTMSDEPRPVLEAIQKLTRDVRNAAKLLGVREARYLVDTYYVLQDYRIATSNRGRASVEGAEPMEVIEWLLTQMETLEHQIRSVLDVWGKAQPMGPWSRAICGIGPVITAGLLANIDITRAPTVGHIWSFAGLNPERRWEKGQKRPWNASLKRLCWLIGESFVKVSGNPRDRYGKLYLERKAYEAAKNERGDYREQAAATLARMKNKRRRETPDGTEPPADAAETKRYRVLLESGMLPPAALHERSKRWAVKLFLAHYHGEAYRQYYGVDAPKPYPIAHLGHVHVIEHQP